MDRLPAEHLDQAARPTLSRSVRYATITAATTAANTFTAAAQGAITTTITATTHHHHQFIWIKPNTNAKAV